MTEKLSNIAQWVSEYPHKAGIINHPPFRAFFSRTPPPNTEETPEWKRLIASLESETSTGNEPSEN